ncbi:hypothetical protein ABZS79_23550 [Streptomyces griseoloalbus]|uniref:hypothetical protein n=1 Tax=Streptomyces griseoloalbus TaxID=67303 RepID=UPI0033B6613B
MSDGGVAEQAEAETRPGRFAVLRRHWLLTSAVALALIATATAVPLVLADSGDDTPCQDVPASTRALAKDPAAATRALDPGDDMARHPAVRKLIRQENPCGDGARVLGALIEAATRADRQGTVHTVAQARAAYAVVAALDWAEVPDGMEPGLARNAADRTEPACGTPVPRYGGTLQTAKGTRGGGGQRASASRTCSGVGAVPPRWAGIHQVSSGPLGRTG